MNTNRPRVLSVGQCDFDHGNIERLLVEQFGAEVERAAIGGDAFQAVRSGRFNLVLVNRILDADGSSGLDLMRQLQSDSETRGTPMALVSQHLEAQDAAVALGARRGFGKGALTGPETHAQLASLLRR